MVKLSQRLQMIAERVPAGARMADIGSDHALLPTYLAQKGMISFAVAGEVNPGPLKAAAKQVADAGLTSVIEVRSGNGLEVIAPGEVEVLTIAGMGGSLIASILEAGQDKLTGVHTLVLQPNVGEDQVRRWLDRHGWFLASEAILEEDGKIYEILCAVKAPAADSASDRLYADRLLEEGVTLTKERMLQMGPYLLEQASDVWFRKWESELEKLEMIRRQLTLSAAEASKTKEQEIRKEITSIQEVLACLQRARL